MNTQLVTSMNEQNNFPFPTFRSFHSSSSLFLGSLCLIGTVPFIVFAGSSIELFHSHILIQEPRLAPQFKLVCVPVCCTHSPQT